MEKTEVVALVKRFQQGEKGAFEELYKEVWSKVYYFCYKSLGNKEDTNDATQTVFIKLYNSIGTLSEPNAFNSFLHTIIGYTCADFHRKKFPGEVEELEEYNEFLLENNDDFLPVEAFEKEDIRREITDMLYTLPQKQRVAMLLFYLEGMSTKEIAKITDSKIGAVNNRLITARKSLRERAEILIKKGALNRTMAIVPIPILTRILLEEMNRIATPEVCEIIWENLCCSLGITSTVGIMAAESASTIPATTTATTAGIATNIAIGVCTLTILVTGGYIAWQTNENVEMPLAIEYVYENPTERAEESIDFANLIQSITNQTEFAEFTTAHGFRFLNMEWTSDTGRKTLYFLEYKNQFIYLGYIEDLQNNFRVVYEITDNDGAIMTAEEIRAWFERHY